MLSVGALLLVASLSVPADTSIKTPFTLVSLWSDEMSDYLTGLRQQPCSGTRAVGCERLDVGVCDGTAPFYFSSSSTAGKQGPYREPGRQTVSADPQYFQLSLFNAASGPNLYQYYAPTFGEIQMVFMCSFSGNRGCPAGRFQIDRLQRVELSRLGSNDTVDVTGRAQVLPDGPIVLPIDQALKQSVFNDPNATYQVRVVAECFSVRSPAREWTLPLYAEPSATAPRAGAIVVRVTPGVGMDFRYRPAAGPDIAFEPDWVEADWGYSLEMDQTALDSREDWYQLPRRPFPAPVWIHLPPRALDRPEVTLDEHSVYTLTKTIKARRRDGRGTVSFRAGTNIFIVGKRDRALEIRKEERYDMPCDEGDAKAPRQKVPTYLIDAREFYDGDFHLQLRVAYPKGC